MGVSQGIAEGLMGRCAMKWSTAGTNRVCSRCLALKDTIVGYTDESGVTIPPLHPRCRCAIIYDEVAPPRRIDTKPKPAKPETKPETKPTPVINPILAPMLIPTTTAVATPKPVPNTSESTNEPESDNQFVFDIQSFGGQKLPKNDYNLTVNNEKQNRHFEGTKEYENYVTKAEKTGFKPSKLLPDIDVQELVNEFHGKGIYDPNPRNESARERVDTGRIIGQYWDRKNGVFVDTTWIEIVYSKSGTHIYPNYPPKEIN